MEGAATGGTVDAAGFSETTGALVGTVVQALSNSNQATARKLNWFLIEIWLKLHLTNIHHARPYVDITAGSGRSAVATVYHHLVDQAAKKR